MKIHVPGIGRIKMIVRAASSIFKSKVVILRYHRVYNTQKNILGLCVSPQNFREHLQYLTKHFKVIKLSELAIALKSGHLPKRAVVITFDDGYVDNLLNAKPLLEQYDLPATVFITTGYLGQEPWWDTLERWILTTPIFPEYLRITLNGRDYGWDLTKWEDRYQTYNALYWFIRPLGEKEREDIFSQLREQLKIKEEKISDSRIMSADEIRQLVNNNLIEVGAHTNLHFVLSKQPPEIQKKEIFESKQILENILGKRIETFAYPYGGEKDISQETIKFVKEANYEVACTTERASVTNKSHPLLLPRFGVRDWNGDEFAKKIRSWFYE